MAKILIAGGSGLVGKVLSKLLHRNGHQVSWLSRKRKGTEPFPVFEWDLSTQTMDTQALDGVEYVINLAGAGIADKRWTASRKRLIIDSRVQSAALLGKHMTDYPAIKHYLGASAIGYYGDRAGEKIDERSEAGKGFLSESCIAWEKASQEIQNSGIQTSILRIGIVLSLNGGALPKILLPFKFGMANYMGNGKQMYSWIHIDDICEMISFILFNNQSSGTWNGTAPNPVSNLQFTKTIRKVAYSKSLLLPAPAFALKLALGEMSHVVLDSLDVSSKKIQDSGFKFKYPTLEKALAQLLIA